MLHLYGVLVEPPLSLGRYASTQTARREEGLWTWLAGTLVIKTLRDDKKHSAPGATSLADTTAVEGTYNWFEL